MKLDISHIEFSRKDSLRQIRLPTSLTPALAEFIGIMVGDGHLGLYHKKSPTGGPITQSEVKISCNASEKDYINYITELFSFLFNTKLKYEKDKRSNAVLLGIYSKAIVQYLNNVCELPLNNKSSICIPNLIKDSNKDLQCAFLRGLADTDFSVIFRNRIGKGYVYPIIKADFKSMKLVIDLEQLFKVLGYSYCCCYNTIRHDKRFEDTTINSIYLNGKKNFVKWNAEIGFSNPKFQRKANKWQKDGFCAPGY